MDSAESLESTDNSIAIHSDQDASEKQTADCDVPSQKGTEAHQTLCEGSSVPKQNTPNLNEIEQEPSQVAQPTCEENFISPVTNSILEQCKNGKTSKQGESEQGGSMPDPVEESLSKGSMLHCAEEELARHETSESNLDDASDNLKTDKETERTLQIEATVSLSDKSIKEVVSDSETNAAINSILEQPSENVETQLTPKEIRTKNQLQPIDTAVNECATALNAEGEEGSGQTCSAGPLPEKSYIIMEDEDDIRVLSVDSLPERGGDKISSQEAEDSAMLANQTVCSLKENANITVNVDDKLLTSTPLIENNNTSVISKVPASQEHHQKSNSVGITELEQTNMDNRAKLTSPDGEEELCIVPDTEPRIPTDQEKADACEKANKTSSVADEASDKVDEKQKSDSVVPSGKTCSQKIGTGKGEEMEGGIEAEPGSATTTQKFGIQLVSTSSLISRQESVGKVHDQADFLLCSTPQDGIEIGDSGENTCGGCGKLAKCKYHLKLKGLHLCGDECYKAYRKANDPPPPPHPPKVTIRPRKLDKSYVHKCGQCLKKVDIKLEKSLTWETMDFCSDDCLERYQLSFGSHCANCKKKVQSSSLGKYCVRFGYDMKQFCDARCLEDFKKGLKVCSYCQKDISADTEGFLAPVGDKGQFKDFCSQECMEKYDQMSHNTVPPEMTHECAVCNISKPVKVEVLIDSKVQKLCSEPCFAAFKFANSVVADQCDMCKKYYDHNRTENFTVYYDEAPHRFCCKTCMNVYILAKRKIVPCSHCKVKKYNFDMIKKTMSNGHGVMMMCSLHCLHLYGSSSTSHSVPKKNGCEFCGSNSPTLYHLSMSDASVRNFCSPNCVASFQEKFQSKSASDKAPYPLGTPRKIFPKKISTIDDKDQVSSNSAAMPVISSVTSLAPSPGAVPPLSAAPASSPSSVKKPKESETILKTVYKQHYIVKPPVHPKMKNCAVQVTPKTVSKKVSCHPDTCSVGTQTDDPISKPLFIPVPIPVFIPTPMHMYTSPYPVPVPIALPIPVPIFIPTTRNSSKGIFKEIKRIQEKIPSDPYEAELLMMAELVADDKRVENTDTDSEDCEDKTEDIDSGNTAEAGFSPETVTNNTFGNDVLQMALKMASEYDEPAAELTPASSDTLQQIPSKTSNVDGKKGLEDDTEETEHNATSARKRPLCQTSDNPQCAKSKRLRKSSASDLVPVKSEAHVDLITPKVEPTEKPDAHMCLKFTLGVNAWKNWLLHKNEELVKAGGTSKNLKLKQDIIQLTADELNYSLCLFVKEVVNPNGQEYAPDTIYYLCLGIQQYLVENGRIENIFCDPNYEKFTTCLDEIVKKFSNFNVDSNILVTRIEEEHLWESKQLGAHSPYVLLNTLIYFNTKHFNLMTVEEHMQLSFSHIMKHWKRPPNTVGPLKPGSSRNVLLRFYPPQSALDANSKKKKVYEQQENDNNPLRCPVKLYEFYLSKCPESVKTRNDVFYLLPERSCVPESPVWYSTMALGHEQLQKMLNRISLVKEIVML